MTDVAALLRDVVEGYQRAHDDLYALTRTSRDQPHGKPTSRPPTGVDVAARKRLVEVARAILDAQYTAGGPSHPLWPGFNRLGWRSESGPRTWWDRELDMVRVDLDNEVHYWSPGADDAILRAPSGDELRAACNTTLGRVQGVPEHDQDRYHAAVSSVRHAHGLLKAGGAFNLRQSDNECSRPYCRRPIEYRTLRLCRPCYKTAKRLHQQVAPY